MHGHGDDDDKHRVEVGNRGRKGDEYVHVGLTVTQRLKSLYVEVPAT